LPVGSAAWYPPPRTGRAATVARVRALILHGPDDLRLEEAPDPIPGPGEVVLRVDAALTCATDAKMMRNGRHPALPPPPAPFGHEAAGTVLAVGPDVDRPRPGDRVVAANSAPCDACEACRRGRPSLCEDLVYLTGAFAERLLVPARIVARNLLPLPPGLAPELAAMCEPYACAIRTAERSGAGPGDLVAVLGGGVQGQLLTTTLAAAGADVVLFDPHAERRDRALRFGAREALDAPRDAGAAAGARRALAGGRGADVVIEAVGRPEAWEAAVALARRGGDVVFHGGCPPGSTVTIPTFGLHYDELRLQGSYHHTPTTVRRALAGLAAGGAPYGELLGAPVGLGEVPAALRERGAKRPVMV
jgi:L-iditol 2-dehydrogenase